MQLDVVITGVGGQGNVLVSRILAQVAMEAGYSIRTSEAIGMAQREGMVMSQVRMGNKLYGALIPDGGADVLLGLELAETVRGLKKLKKTGVVIANEACIYPVSTTLGISNYQPHQIKQYLQAEVGKLYLLNATELAEKAGTPKAANIVLLGALARLDILPVSHTELLAGVLEMVPARFKNTNKIAFELGYQEVEV